MKKLNNALNEVQDKYIEEAAKADRLQSGTAKTIRNIAIPVASAAAIAGLCFGLNAIGVFGGRQSVDLLPSTSTTTPTSPDQIISDLKGEYYPEQMPLALQTNADIESIVFGSEFPEMLYADAEKAIFTDGIGGVYIYDFSEEQITLAADIYDSLNISVSDFSYTGIDSWNGVSIFALSDGTICCSLSAERFSKISEQTDYKQEFYVMDAENLTLTRDESMNTDGFERYDGLFELPYGEYEAWSIYGAKISGTNDFVYVRDGSSEVSSVHAWGVQTIALDRHSEGKTVYTCSPFREGNVGVSAQLHDYYTAQNGDMLQFFRDGFASLGTAAPNGTPSSAVITSSGDLIKLSASDKTEWIYRFDGYGENLSLVSYNGEGENLLGDTLTLVFGEQYHISEGLNDGGEISLKYSLYGTDEIDETDKITSEIYVELIRDGKAVADSRLACVNLSEGYDGFNHIPRGSAIKIEVLELGDGVSIAAVFVPTLVDGEIVYGMTTYYISGDTLQRLEGGMAFPLPENYSISADPEADTISYVSDGVHHVKALAYDEKGFWYLKEAADAAALADMWLSDWTAISKTYEMSLPQSNVFTVKSPQDGSIYAGFVFPQYKSYVMQLYKVNGSDITRLGDIHSCGNNFDIYSDGKDIILHTEICYSGSGGVDDSGNVIWSDYITDMFYILTDGDPKVIANLQYQIFDGEATDFKICEPAYNATYAQGVTETEYNAEFDRIINELAHIKAVIFENEGVKFLDNPDLLEEEIRQAITEAENSSDSSPESTPGFTADDVAAAVADIEKTERTVLAKTAADLNFDGTNELVLLTTWGKNEIFTYNKVDGKMVQTAQFGMGYLNYIETLDLYHYENGDEKYYYFTFEYDNGTMKADVLSSIQPTSDGYEVKHLLSSGIINYNLQPNVGTAFFREGWSHTEIGIGVEYHDISAAEYYERMKQYPAALNGEDDNSMMNNLIENEMTEYLASLGATPLMADEIPLLVPVLPAIINDNYVTTRFGYDEWRNSYHFGVDIAAVQDTDIYAAAAGKVYIPKFTRFGYGNTIVIDHENGFYTVYAHCDSFEVKEGDTVEAGQHIANVGSTGFSTGSHLHFELRNGTMAVNPTGLGIFTTNQADEIIDSASLSENPEIPQFSAPVDTALGVVTERIDGDGDYLGHAGVDIKADEGTAIFAAADGTVIGSGFMGDYGNCVIIQHDGYLTLYAHLESAIAECGDKLSAGDKIGTMGSTGRATGVHLHFEVITAADKTVNPLIYLPPYAVG